MKLEYDQKAIERFCQQYQLTELSLFGSAARGDMNESSDVDIIIDFERGAGISMLDLVKMRRELTQLFNSRSVDLITRSGLVRSKNPYRKQGILSNVINLYVS